MYLDNSKFWCWWGEFYHTDFSVWIWWGDLRHIFYNSRAGLYRTIFFSPSSRIVNMTEGSSSLFVFVTWFKNECRRLLHLRVISVKLNSYECYQERIHHEILKVGQGVSFQYACTSKDWSKYLQTAQGKSRLLLDFTLILVSQLLGLRDQVAGWRSSF